MRSEAEILRHARESAGLSAQEMADLVGVDQTHLEALEHGADASTDILDRAARAFGLSLGRFLAGEAEGAPATVLFRALHEGPSFADFVETDATAILGEFLRCAADVAELEALLGEGEDRLARELGSLPSGALKGGAGLYEQAERLALDVRQRLGFGLGPVPSMVELTRDRLGISLFWVGPDELDRDIDAACARAPGPAILINLVGGPQCWWRTRMTLAHELCHLLFDLDRAAPAAPRRRFLFSPYRGESSRGARRARVHLPSELETAERRANAFAAHFLAPPEGVKLAVGGLVPTSTDAVNAVCRRFQIGRETAVNQLTNTYGLSKEERHGLLSRPASDVLPREHPDAAPRPGLRAGRLHDLVARAL
ncbi:MAG TPA: XRE family transcriptional regulator, partial [Polyangiaceae bacterium]|nr:XRE family transcriptional regulator [Polyangiaceae bacterium]